MNATAGFRRVSLFWALTIEPDKTNPFEKSPRQNAEANSRKPAGLNKAATLLEAALASIKTVRKNLGGVTLIGQSAEDLGDNADSIVNSCSSFLFLPDPTFNRAHYRELFNLNTQQLTLFESLQERSAVHPA